MKPKYKITPKRDWSGKGFLINGKWVRSGWIVTDGICNIMPGATWFQTIPQAMHAIFCLENSNGDSDLFWQMMRHPALKVPA